MMNLYGLITADIISIQMSGTNGKRAMTNKAKTDNLET